MGAKVDYPDRRLAAVAARQHGIVTSEQLRECGVGRGAIRRRVEGGRLLRVHRGVYAVGHRPASWEAAWMAAVLASGDEAVLSHASAAALWGLLPPIRGPIDVSVPTNAGRLSRAGVRLHRREALASSRDSRRHFTRRRSIPVTALDLTIADLRTTLEPRLVRRAIRQAELFRGFEGSSSTRGTRSDLELEFLAFCRRHRLPAPDVNVELATDLTVDFLWPAPKLVVETDGHRYHRGSVAFEDDHLRDLRLRRLGYAVHRYTGAQLRRYAVEIATELGEKLSRASRPS